MSNVLKTVFAILSALLVFTSAPVFAQAPDREFTISVGETLTFNARGVRNITVGLSKVVNVVPSGNQITMTGLSQGVTTVNIFSDREQKTLLIRVVPVNPEALAAEVREVLGERSGVVVRVVKGRVLLEGEVASEVYKEKINVLTGLYKNQVLNFTQFREAFVEGARQVALELHYVKIGAANSDRLGIHWGQFLGANYSFGAGDVPLYYGGPSNPENIANNTGILPVDPGNPDRLPAPVALTGGDGASYWSLVGNLNAALDLIEQVGLIRTVQTSTIVTETGTEAEFHSGGIVNVVSLGNLITIPYGVRVNVKPILDFENRVKLVLDSTYTELDNANEVNGVPATRNSDFKSVVNMVEGQSVLVMANRGYTDSSGDQGIYMLGRIPFLGFLFKGRNRNLQKENVAVFLTPRVYEPGGKFHKTLVEGIFETLLEDGAETDDLPEIINASKSKSDANKKRPKKAKEDEKSKKSKKSDKKK